MLIAALTTEDADITNLGTTQDPPSASECGLHQLLVLSNYNYLTKLFHVTAYILRFIYNCRNPATKQKGIIIAKKSILLGITSLLFTLHNPLCSDRSTSSTIINCSCISNYGKFSLISRRNQQSTIAILSAGSTFTNYQHRESNVIILDPPFHLSLENSILC